MPRIASLSAIEILDSRGRPTVKVTCGLADGHIGSASVPSGASTGDAEAVELRDGDANRYRGAGCRNAVRNVNEESNSFATRFDFASQKMFDQFLIEKDGTPNKSRLGANAILACSIAFTRANAAAAGQPLYQQFGSLVETAPWRLPRLSVNLFSGGKHAGGNVPIQDVLIVPVTPTSIDESLSMTYEVYQSAADLCAAKYQMRLLTADEGGLSPPVDSCETLFELGLEAIRTAGLTHDVRLAVDVASSHFERNGRYHLGDQILDGDGMISQLARWIDDYSLMSVEDGLSQEDWPHWKNFRSSAAGKTLVIGDDLLCTNPERIRRAVKEQAADTLLLKVNQIGTLTEAADANRLARQAGWSVVISARSGETEDDWLADLAVGWSGDFIKVGSINQSERLAKYNRLLEIERETGWTIPQWARG